MFKRGLIKYYLNGILFLKTLKKKSLTKKIKIKSKFNVRKPLITIGKHFLNLA
jgi:hypothetical protein